MHPVRRTQARKATELRWMVYLMASSVLRSGFRGLHLDMHSIDQIVRGSRDYCVAVRNSTCDLDGVAEVSSESDLLQSDLALVRYCRDLRPGGLVKNCSRRDDQGRYRR